MPERTFSSERLSLDDIMARYPDTWVGLRDIRYEDGDTNIGSAVVSLIGTKKELYDRLLSDEIDYVLCTRSESIYDNWSNWK